MAAVSLASRRDAAKKKPGLRCPALHCGQSWRPGGPAPHPLSTPRIHSLPPQLQPSPSLARFADIWAPICRGEDPPPDAIALPPPGDAPAAAAPPPAPGGGSADGGGGGEPARARSLGRVWSAPSAGGVAGLDAEARAVAVGGARLARIEHALPDASPGGRTI